MLNNQYVQNPGNTLVFPGDTLDVVPTPHAGWEIGAYALALSLFSAGLGVISALINRAPGAVHSEEDEDQQGFTGSQTTRGPGRIIPLAVGDVWGGGHIVSSQVTGFIDDLPGLESTQFGTQESSRSQDKSRPLHTTVVYAGHEIESFEGFEIDGVDVEDLTGIIREEALGTRDQAPPRGYSDSATTKSVNNTVVNGQPVVVSGDSPHQQALIALTFPSGLYWINQQNGAIRSATVTISIEYKLSTESSWTMYKTMNISASNRGLFDYRILLPIRLTAEYDYRLTRVTPNFSDTDHSLPPDRDVVDEFEWATLTEIHPGSRAYSGLAWVDYSQIPVDRQAVPQQYKARMLGLNKIRIYTDETTYTVGYTDNPAWVFAFLLTSDVWGPGRFYDYEDLDIAKFIEWANHNDELVTDFEGDNPGLHKRNVISHVFTKPYTVEALREMAKLHDGYLIEQAGYWSVYVDKLQEPVGLITKGSYVASSLRVSDDFATDAPQRITGKFLNHSTKKGEDDIYPFVDHENLDAIEAAAQQAEDGTKDCTSIGRRAQVLRHLAKDVRSRNEETKIIEMQMGLDGHHYEVGKVVNVSLPSGSVGIGSGRTHVGSTGRTVKLAEAVAFDPDLDYEISITDEAGGVVSTEPLVNPGITTTIVNTVDLNPAWDMRDGLHYGIGEVGYSIAPYLIVEKAFNEDMTSRMVLRQYSTNKYVFPDIDLTDNTTSFREITGEKVPGQVETLSATLVETDDGAGLRIDLAWMPPIIPDLVSNYSVYWRITNRIFDSPIYVNTWQARADDDSGFATRGEEGWFDQGGVTHYESDENYAQVLAEQGVRRSGLFQYHDLRDDTDDLQYRFEHLHTGPTLQFSIENDVEHSTSYEIAVVAISPLGKHLGFDRAAKVRVETGT